MIHQNRHLYLKDFREADHLKILLIQKVEKLKFSQTVSDFGYDDCPGHPVWIEPCKWLGKKK